MRRAVCTRSETGGATISSIQLQGSSIFRNMTDETEKKMADDESVTSDKMNSLINWVENIREQCRAKSESENQRLVDAISRKGTINISPPIPMSRYSNLLKPALGGTCIKVAECIVPHGNMVAELLQSVKELGDKCLDLQRELDDQSVKIPCDECTALQKEVDVYKKIIHGHGQNFAKASQLINQLEPVISKLESLSDNSMAIREHQNVQIKKLQELQELVVTPPEPVLDYAKIASLIPKQPTQEAAPPAPVNIRKFVKMSAEEFQKKSNLMVYGLKPDIGCSAQECVLKLFKGCGVGSISSLSGNIVSAHFVSRDQEKPALRAVLKNQFIIDEILGAAKGLRNSQYKDVYLSRDRTAREQDRLRKTVTELKKKIKDFPDKRWAIVRGVVVEKGQFEPIK